jgi:hypothetical protein
MVMKFSGFFADRGGVVKPKVRVGVQCRDCESPNSPYPLRRKYLSPKRPDRIRLLGGEGLGVFLLFVGWCICGRSGDKAGSIVVAIPSSSSLDVELIELDGALPVAMWVFPLPSTFPGIVAPDEVSARESSIEINLADTISVFIFDEFSVVLIDFRVSETVAGACSVTSKTWNTQC